MIVGATMILPSEVEHKLYAGGIGFIRGDLVKGGSEHTELVSITTRATDE